MRQDSDSQLSLRPKRPSFPRLIPAILVWDEYKSIPLLAKPGLTGKRGLTDEGGRFVRSKVVELLRGAPLTHGFSASKMFSTTWDIGEKMLNCWHLNVGSGMRERTEGHLFRYDGAKATPQMKTYAHGGKDSPTFSANTRPFYASLNYSRAKYGGSSGWGKTHFVMKKVLIFNATFTYADSFDVESGHKDQGYKLLFSRDIEIVCVATSEHPATSVVGKNLAKFAAKHCLRYKGI